LCNLPIRSCLVWADYRTKALALTVALLTVTAAISGASGSNEEVAFGLTSKGQSFIGTLLPLMSGSMSQGSCR
jgi:hypothetical protein